MHRNFHRILHLARIFALTMLASIPFSSAVTWGANKTKYEYGHDVLAKLRNPAFVPGPAGSLKLPATRPRYETFAPTIEVFLKEHLFADIFVFG